MISQDINKVDSFVFPRIKEHMESPNTRDVTPPHLIGKVKVLHNGITGTRSIHTKHDGHYFVHKVHGSNLSSVSWFKLGFQPKPLGYYSHRNIIRDRIENHHSTVARMADQGLLDLLRYDGATLARKNEYFLNKIESLRKMPKTFSPTSKKPYTTVYRMQNAAGEGPYHDTDIDDDWQDESNAENQPPPMSDRGFTGEDHEALMEPSVKFGFEDKAHAKKWFNSKEMKALKEKGHKLVPVKASHVWSSGKQAFFKKYVAPIRKKRG